VQGLHRQRQGRVRPTRAGQRAPAAGADLAAADLGARLRDAWNAPAQDPVAYGFLVNLEQEHVRMASNFVSIYLQKLEPTEGDGALEGANKT
jgi:hypothetical protein